MFTYILCIHFLTVKHIRLIIHHKKHTHNNIHTTTYTQQHTHNNIHTTNIHKHNIQTTNTQHTCTYTPLTQTHTQNTQHTYTHTNTHMHIHTKHIRVINRKGPFDSSVILCVHYLHRLTVETCSITLACAGWEALIRAYINALLHMGKVWVTNIR